MSEFIIKKYSKTKVNKPVMIVGLPGTGNVGRIVIDYMIKTLKAKRYIDIFSSSFPNSVFIQKDSTIRLPSVYMFYAKKGKTEYLLVTGDMQPMEEIKSYNLSKVIADIGKKENVKEIITIGGIGLKKVPQNPKVHCVASNAKYLKDLKEVGVTDGNKTVGFIVGVSGLLLGFSQLNKTKAVSFLGETYNHPSHFGIKSAHAILKSMFKYLNVKISLNEMEKEINKIDKEVKKRKIAKKEVTKAINKVDIGGLKYIG